MWRIKMQLYIPEVKDMKELKEILKDKQKIIK